MRGMFPDVLGNAAAKTQREVQPLAWGGVCGGGRCSEPLLAIRHIGAHALASFLRRDELEKFHALFTS